MDARLIPDLPFPHKSAPRVINAGWLHGSLDAAIIPSFALQYGADINTVRKALCRDGTGRALGPVGAALDIIAGVAAP